jgi:hypothetical protein
MKQLKMSDRVVAYEVMFLVKTLFVINTLFSVNEYVLVHSGAVKSFVHGDSITLCWKSEHEC